MPEELREEGAFLPYPLFSEPSLSGPAVRESALAEHSLGRLDEASSRFAELPGFARATRVRDACASAGMAGYPVALREALAVSLDPRHGTPEQVVLPHLRGFELGFAKVEEGADTGDPDLLGEVAAALTGRAHHPDEPLRRGQGWLGPSRERAWLLTPTSAHLAGALAQWTVWVQAKPALPRVARLALAHLQLELLQPFEVPDGHVARLFTMLELVRAGMLRASVLPLSVWLDRAGDEYRDQVRRVVRTGDHGPWVEFFARGVRELADAQVDLLRGLESLAATYRATLPEGGRLARVANSLLGFPAVDHPTLCATEGLSPKGATLLTDRLVAEGVLYPWESRRYRKVFLCQEALSLLPPPHP
ncbi:MULTISPECIES: Fic family protein [Actinosynnema]|uniref:Fic family protein n=1 Tax=Actinosynnema TaxID=40566 RepID=UPI0020A5DFC8|nr:hypothetical protein [Actinosynnema pretiosum]